MNESLDVWIERQYRHAAIAMLRSISPVDRIRTRPGFGQRIQPLRGAIVASPVPGAYDPEPDYFFHWYRDSALVIDALRLLYLDADSDIDALALFDDFVRFSVSLQALDGRTLVAAPGWRNGVAPDHVQYLRTDADLGAVHDGAVAAETRVNPDGTLDISRWGRPQFDGPALRALTLLRWTQAIAQDAGLDRPIADLLRADLAFVMEHARTPCIDIWEEELGQHYYTLRVAAAALENGADWLDQPPRGTSQDRQASQIYRVEAALLRDMLDDYWLADQGYYHSRTLSSGARSTRELDIAVILATLHSANSRPWPARAWRASELRHTVHDPQMHATLARLTTLFDAAYPINHGRPAVYAPAMGRYSGDNYYSGGAYYFSTLAAAEFYFRAAVTNADAGAGATQAYIRRGDAFLETVRAFTPPSGEMSEQFDQRTGRQNSARDLAWSYAACISCITARRRAITRLRPPACRDAV